MDQAGIEQALTAARQARREGRRDEATQMLLAVIERAGEQPTALNMLGLNALAEGDHANAASFLRRAIAADPASPDLWMNLARVRREQGDEAGEREALEGALAID